ncbi:disks large-associated protein 2-like [Schistocerca cancellata]|uniref:disks large-associated protein 2-like n=1 Tax=Schistocerca cancellata TaxID=274614 RepID=UPI00211955DE|nr:disks large-associated protein 2-like [Schistocerca cancellata]
MCETKLFRTLANEQTETLTQKCQEWGNLQDNRNISEDIVGQIRSVIGSTRLLINDKIQFFHKLLDMADNTDSERRITPEDLQAYWDLIVIEKEGLAAERGSSSQCCENHRDWCSVKGASKAMQCKSMKNTLRPTSGSFEQLNKTSARRICSTSVKKSLVEEKEIIKKVKSDVRNGKISHA